MRTAGPPFLYVLAAAVLAGFLAPAVAPGEPVPAALWNVKLGFSYLAAGGNADASSSSADVAFSRAGRSWAVEGSAAGVSAAKRRRRTAENYHAQVRAGRKLRKRLQITLGLRWERNRFAGLDGREGADVSVQWELRDTPAWKLRALGGLAVAREEPRGGRPAAESFGGLLQLSGDARVSETASWDGQVTLFPNFRDLEDYRVHGHLGLQAALSRHLGLRLGYDLKLDHRPVPGFGTTDTVAAAALVLQLGGKPAP